MRAYRRAAELIRSTPADVAELVRAGRVRELAGIGPGIEARLKRARRDRRARRAARARSAGAAGARRGRSAARSLAETDARDRPHARDSNARRAARGGRRGDGSTACPESGRRRRRRSSPGSRSSSTARPRRGMTLNRARRSSARSPRHSAAKPQATRAAACDLSNHFAVVVPRDQTVTRRSRRCLRSSPCSSRTSGASSASPSRAIRSRSSRPNRSASGRSCVRATGSPAYVAVARRRCPMRPRRSTCTRCSAARSGHPSCARWTHGDPPPDLLELDHIRGDLHVHTTGSDGKATVEEMGTSRAGARLRVPGDLRPHAQRPRRPGTRRRRRSAGRARRSQPRTRCSRPFRVLRGSECDILPDGSLDLPDDVLAELDWVQISLHAGQRWGAKALTDRVLEAMRHPAPRASPIRRAGSSITGPRTLSISTASSSVALETGVALEVNGLPGPARPRGGHVRERARRGRQDRLLDRRALGARAREHGALGRDRAPRRRTAWRRRERAAAAGGPTRLKRPARVPPTRAPRTSACRAAPRRPRVGVRRVEDVMVEVAADRDVAERDVRDDPQRLDGQLRLGDGVVLELELGRELHQIGPVGAGA